MKFVIRNSTTEFLIFQIEGTEDEVQVVYRDKSIWCVQKAMAQLFDVGVSDISKHQKIFFSRESLWKIQLFPKWKQPQTSDVDNIQETMAYEDRNKEFEQYLTSSEPGMEERARNY